MSREVCSAAIGLEVGFRLAQSGGADIVFGKDFEMVSVYSMCGTLGEAVCQAFEDNSEENDWYLCLDSLAERVIEMGPDSIGMSEATAARLVAEVLAEQEVSDGEGE